jgi:hypothetical protein
MSQLRVAKLELFSTGTMFPPAAPKQRNLGGAIFLVAIDDYRSIDDEIHQTAKAFLFPRTVEWQDHFDWAVSMTEGLNATWLRGELDRTRAKWDKLRAGRMRAHGRTRTQLMTRRKAYELIRRRAEAGVGGGEPAVQLPRAACGARDRGAAPEL